MKNRVLWSVVLITLLASLGFVLIGCQGGGEKEVRIAFMDCLSGSNADAGIQDLNAAQLAVDDINAAGGIKALGGAKLKLVAVDMTSDPKNAASTAERTFSTEKVVAAKCPGISGVALPMLPIAEKAQVPVICNSINDQISGQGYKYTFRTGCRVAQSGKCTCNPGRRSGR